MRLRIKLTLVTALLMTFIFAIGGLGLYQLFRSRLLEGMEEGLLARAQALAAQEELPRNAVLGPSVGEPEDSFAQILDRDGQVLASSWALKNVDRHPEAVVNPGVYRPMLGRRFQPNSFGWRFVDREVTIAVEGIPPRPETVPARLIVYVSEGLLVVIAGRSLEDVNEALASLASLLWVGGPIALVLVAGVGWVMVRSALRPVERMRAEAAAISETELSRRLPVPNHRDEVGRLGATLNDMLDRLENAVDRERRFVDDAAHELRTPLANLKAELELSMRRARTPEDLRRVLRSANEEAERLVRLAEDLLVLSRADRGRLTVKREDSDVGELLVPTAENFRARASERGVSLRVKTTSHVRARLDPMRFRQMVGNLLENAIRYTTSGGRVTVELRAEDGSWVIEVADTGEGFNEAFLARAFEPFGRSDESRSRAGGGTGLGLTIVRAIAEAHDGKVEARNGEEGGAIVVLTFPSEDLMDGSRSSHPRPEMLSASDRKERP